MLGTILIGTLLMGPAPVEPAELDRDPIRDPVRVVTTLPIYAELVREIGGAEVDVTSIANPNEDAGSFR